MSGKRMWTAVAVALSGAVAAAQAPQTTPSGDQKAAAASPAVTVVGCVQKESDVLKHNPMVSSTGMGDEFVLTA